MNATVRQPGEVPQYADVDFASIPVAELLGGERRLEGESYLSEGYSVRKQIESSGLPVEPLSRIADVWQPGRLKGVRVRAEDGLPFLTATQTFDTRPMARKWLAPGKVSHLEERFVEPGWILVTCSGSVGDAIMSYSAHKGVIVSHDLLRVQVREPEELGYVYAFLRTRYGRTVMRSSKYGSIIKHLEPEHLDKVPVPFLGDDLRVTASQRMAQVFELRDEALRHFREAETRYEQEITDYGGEPSSEISYTVSASRIFGRQRRLDGYYYNPEAERILQQLRATGKELAPLSSVVDGVFGVPRFKHVYADDGIPYLDSEDLFKVNPEITKFIPQATKKNADAYYVERGWLLMACSGQIYGFNGNVVLANEWHEAKIVSNHVIRIVPSKGDIRPGYLRMVLGHPMLGRSLVIRCAFGTEVPEIAPEDVQNLPIIRLEPSAEVKIAELVESADALRRQADQEEDAVTMLVEAELDRLLDTA